MSEPQRHSFAELEAATGGFAGGRILGEGGFGAVYRGELATGALVAVKRLTQEAGPGTAAGLTSVDQFEAEVRVIASYSHAHLLPVIGYCDEDGGAVEGAVCRRTCIVYPLMINGSLEQKLFAGVPSLTWSSRVRILTEVHRRTFLLRTASSCEGGAEYLGFADGQSLSLAGVPRYL